MGILAEDKRSIEEVVYDIKKANSAVYASALSGYEEVGKNLFNNPNYSSQEIMQAFGADWDTMSSLINTELMLIRIVDPTYTPPATGI